MAKPELLFDVVLVDGYHDIQMVHRSGVPMAEALKASTTYNAKKIPGQGLVAVVVIPGTYTPTLAPKKSAEPATYVNEHGRGVQRLLVGHLEHVLEVVRAPDAIVHHADIGIVAKSFKRLAAQCTELDIPSKNYNPDKWEWESWNFDRAMNGEYEHTELECALELLLDEALPEPEEPCVA